MSANYYFPLKSLLMKKKFLTHEQVLEILEMKKNVLECTECGNLYVLATERNPAELSCKKCGGKLSFAFPEERKKHLERETKKVLRERLKQREKKAR